MVYYRQCGSIICPNKCYKETTKRRQKPYIHIHVFLRLKVQKLMVHNYIRHQVSFHFVKAKLYFFFVNVSSLNMLTYFKCISLLPEGDYGI